MKKLKNRQGITLISLIVTIVILLILAGVAIALLSGEDGILSRTEKAATSYQTESIKEIVNLKLANLNAGKWIDEGRRAVLKDLNEVDDESSQNFDAEIVLKNPVEDSDTSAVLIFDQHEIEVNSLLNITKIDGETQEGTSGGNTGNTSSGESGSTNGGNAGSIDSAEYAQMQATIAQLQVTTGQMQQKIDELEAKNAIIEGKYATKTELDNANDKIDSNREQIDHMLTTLDVDTRTTLFQGTADTVGKNYIISDITDYKYLFVYMDYYDAVASVKARFNGETKIINVDDIVYNTAGSWEGVDGTYFFAETWDYHTVSMGMYFINSTTFHVEWNASSKTFSNPRIYKIEGIK